MDPVFLSIIAMIVVTWAFVGVMLFLARKRAGNRRTYKIPPEDIKCRNEVFPRRIGTVSTYSRDGGTSWRWNFMVEGDIVLRSCSDHDSDDEAAGHAVRVISGVFDRMDYRVLPDAENKWFFKIIVDGVTAVGTNEYKTFFEASTMARELFEQPWGADGKITIIDDPINEGAAASKRGGAPTEDQAAPSPSTPPPPEDAEWDAPLPLMSYSDETKPQQDTDWK